ncbi:hypothetical protein RMN57_18800 [Kitasatospora sp. CM 4170]|uniref:Uncharacterized protein n=1 Tax=Kitasatospora aburaviensis TaxID=67265 RepID=A0ABW1F6W0_9ACTN|nr:hypothetical protein [Kitasatospora sp. CM 4170]WNM46607.1 hypothetical protein RMN57_18800 [Kitasatospora sp. CM 4170]
MSQAVSKSIAIGSAVAGAIFLAWFVYLYVTGGEVWWRTTTAFGATTAFGIALWGFFDFASSPKVIGGGIAGIVAISVGVSSLTPFPPKVRDLSCGHSHTNPADRQRGYVAVLPGENAAQSRITVCDVNVNDGAPIRNSYSLQETLFGTLPADAEVSLIRQPDAGTCTTDGHFGTGGYYYSKVIDFGKGANSWTLNVEVPDWQKTLKYTYFIAVTPIDTKRTFDDQQIAWQNENGKREGWPGMRQIPGHILGSFYVQPATPEKACKAA